MQKFFFKLFIMIFYGENSNTKSSFLIKMIKTIWVNIVWNTVIQNLVL